MIQIGYGPAQTAIRSAESDQIRYLASRAQCELGIGDAVNSLPSPAYGWF